MRAVSKILASVLATCVSNAFMQRKLMSESYTVLADPGPLSAENNKLKQRKPTVQHVGLPSKNRKNPKQKKNNVSGLLAPPLSHGTKTKKKNVSGLLAPPPPPPPEPKKKNTMFQDSW